MQLGIEGVNFNYDDNGDPVAVADQTGLAEQQGHNNNVDYWCAVTAVKTLGSIEKDIQAVTPQGIPQDFCMIRSWLTTTDRLLSMKQARLTPTVCSQPLSMLLPSTTRRCMICILSTVTS